MSIVFSGIQPTGGMHIGNYLSVLKQWKELQLLNYDYIFYSIVDLHSMTSMFKSSDAIYIQENVNNLFMTYLACGIDPEKSIIFQQSSVSYHTQLCWILFNYTNMGWLDRMTQFKDKNDNNLSLGLYLYPVLMAADILLYKATDVPVGIDQIQHIELTRVLADRFNSIHKKALMTIPRPILAKCSKIMDLRDPTKKMSTSACSKLGTIFILDNIDDIRKKITKAVTDSDPYISYNVEARPGISNLINIYSLIYDVSTDDVVKEYSGLQCSQFKSVIADAIIEEVKPIQDRYTKLKADIGFCRDLLINGGLRANDIAEVNFREFNELVLGII